MISKLIPFLNQFFLLESRLQYLLICFQYSICRFFPKQFNESNWATRFTGTFLIYNQYMSHGTGILFKVLCLGGGGGGGVDPPPHTLLIFLHPLTGLERRDQTRYAAALLSPNDKIGFQYHDKYWWLIIDNDDQQKYKSGSSLLSEDLWHCRWVDVNSIDRLTVIGTS